MNPSTNFQTEAEDAMALLNTRNGNYSAACALDFMNPPWNHVSGRASLHPAGMYDDFATRDFNGNVLGSHLYPYFSSRKSKKAILAREAIPVQSCWNGVGKVPCEYLPHRSVPLTSKKWLSTPSHFKQAPRLFDSDRSPTALRRITWKPPNAV